MPKIVCNDCDHVTSNPSATGPIKEVDEDGKLHMNWAYICPKCFSENVRPYKWHCSICGPVNGTCDGLDGSFAQRCAAEPEGVEYARNQR